MSDKKISQLTPGGAVSATDLLAAVQSGATVKITPAQLADFIKSALAPYLSFISGRQVNSAINGVSVAIGVAIILTGQSIASQHGSLTETTDDTVVLGGMSITSQQGALAGVGMLADFFSDDAQSDPLYTDDAQLNPYDWTD